MKMLLVDDHPTVIRGISLILKEAFHGVELFTAGSLHEARAQLDRIVPDIVFQDINLPDGNGYEILTERAGKTQTRWIILSMYQDAELAREALEKGASAFVCKDADDAEIKLAVEHALQNKNYVSASVVQNLVTLAATKNPAVERFSQLTPTEKRILFYVSDSKTSKEIASLLNISHRTVENHRNNICSKLGLFGTNALLHFVINHRNEIHNLLDSI